MESIASFINLNVLSASCAEALMAKPRSKSGTDAVSEIKKQCNNWNSNAGYKSLAHLTLSLPESNLVCDHSNESY